MAIGDYTKTTFVNGLGGGTPINATNLNHSENKVQEIDDGLEDGTIISLTNNKRKSMAWSLMLNI